MNPRKEEGFFTRFAKNFEYLFKAFSPLYRAINAITQTVFGPLARFVNGFSELAKETTGPMKYVYQGINIGFIGLAGYAVITLTPAALSAAGWAAAGLTTASWAKNTVYPAIIDYRDYVAKRDAPDARDDLQTLKERSDQSWNDVKWGLVPVVGFTLLPLSTVALATTYAASFALPFVGLGGTGLVILAAARAEIMQFVFPSAETETVRASSTEETAKPRGMSVTSILTSLSTASTKRPSPTAALSSSSNPSSTAKLWAKPPAPDTFMNDETLDASKTSRPKQDSKK